MATTAQRAPRQGFWEEGGFFHLSALQGRFVAKRDMDLAALDG